jgi:hypothetical protein
MLSDIIKAFETRNPGVASFETFAADCMAGMKGDPANASLYLLLGLTARQFYDQFADQPLTVERANDTRKRMVELARKAEASLREPATAKIEALNRIALEAFGNPG